MLNLEHIDLLELSGGSYETPAMQGETRDGSTLAREAYFLEFAKALKQEATMPIMVTGGIRRKIIAEQVIDSGIEMTGIATALAIKPDLVNAWKNNDDAVPTLRSITWKAKPLAALANMAMVKYQLNRQSQSQTSRPNVSPLWALLLQQVSNWQRTRRYKAALHNH